MQDQLVPFMALADGDSSSGRRSSSNSSSSGLQQRQRLRSGCHRLVLQKKRWRTGP